MFHIKILLLLFIFYNSLTIKYLLFLIYTISKNGVEVMSLRSLTGFIISFSVILITGCTTSEVVHDTIYLQNAKINAPLVQIPVFLSTSDTTSNFIITPRIFIGRNETFKGQISGHSLVNQTGIFQVDSSNSYEIPGVNIYDFKGDNFQLYTSTFNFGFDADFMIGEKVLLSGGLNFSSIENSSLIGFRGGLGFKNYNRPMGFRFDIGLSWQELQYDVQSLIVREKSSSNTNEVFFLRDKGKQKNSGFYLNFNLTHDDPESPIGGFANLGYIEQYMLDIEPLEYDNSVYDEPFNNSEYQQSDLRNEIKSGFFNVSAGILLKITDNLRVMGGIKYFTEITDKNIIPDYISPFVQFHLAL
jgi:hypothetical protein